MELTTNKVDEILSKVVVWQFIILSINYNIKEILDINIPLFRSLLSLISMSIVAIFFILTLKYVWIRSSKFIILNLVFVTFIISINMLVFNDNIPYISSVSFWLVGIALPTAIYVYSIKNKLLLLETLSKYVYLLIIINWIYAFKVLINDDITYDMVYSYQLLLPIILLIYLQFVRFKLIDIFIILISIFFITIIGSRGPLLAIFLYLIYKIIEYLLNNQLTIKKIIMSNIIIIILLTLVFKYKQILEYITNKLIELNISSRTIFLLNEKNIDFSTGRNDIFFTSLENLKDRPLTGYGLAGDRVLLSGTYPHNIFIELLYQFGIVMGLILITILLSFIFITMINVRFKNRDLIIIFMFVGFVPLLYTGSYLTSTNFWVFIFLIIASFKVGTGEYD